MTLPTIFKSEVGDILVALASAARDRHSDYAKALADVATALGLDPPHTGTVIEHKRKRYES